MKKLSILILILSFVLIACDDDSSDNNSNNTNNITDPCEPNPCTEDHKTVCTSVDGTAVCSCDEGYTVDGTACIQLANPCEPNPCTDVDYGMHKNTCTDNGDGSFTCECNLGFEADVNGACIPVTVEVCPTGLQCKGGVCVPSDISSEQCMGDIDCQENAGPSDGNYATCNNTPAGGVCTGCRPGEPDDCPTGYICSDFGSCNKTCNDDNECPYGHCTSDGGICVLDHCLSDADCLNGTVCIDENDDGEGLCERINCIETECSIYNPDGSCPSGFSCIGGNCVSSCNPNPCSEPHKTVCDTDSGIPVCSCDNGYVENIDGECEPETVSDCMNGFTCVNNYCVSDTEPFQCVIDSDCGTGMTCSPTLPSGQCSGCSDAVTDCPTGFDVCLAGYCLKACSSNSDCPEAMDCNISAGVCGKRSCATSVDCPDGYVCNNDKCERIPCTQ